MYRPQNLRLPGPTFVPQAVLQASARPIINHRGPEFAALLAAVTRALQDFLQTRNDVLLLTSSGTGGLEAALVNVLSPGDKVIAFNNGSFGERWAAMAKAFGLDVRRVDVQPGRAIEPDLVRDELRKDATTKAVLVTHNETSVGVLNPLKDIAPVVRESGKLFLVDSISGAGAIELDVDGWGIDVLVTASQKGWGAPPGIAMVAVSERAWKATETASSPRYYFDFQKAKASLEKGATPWTPAITVVIALQESLRLMSEEGLESIIERHEDLARATRKGVQALGLQLFADELYASPVVTAVRSPARVDSRNLARVLRDEYDCVVAGGQGKLEGQIFRIGHMGFVTIADIIAMFGALELAVRRFNISAEPGTAITAALRAYAAEPVPAGARRG